MPIYGDSSLEGLYWWPVFIVVSQQRAQPSWLPSQESTGILPCDRQAHCDLPTPHPYIIIYNYKGTGSRDISMRISTGFCISKMFLWWAIANAIFPTVNVKTNWRNSKYWRLLQNLWITLSNIVLKLPHLHYNRFLWTDKHIRVTVKFFAFLCCPTIGLFYQIRKKYWS